MKCYFNMKRIITLLGFSSCFIEELSPSSCGIDNSPVNVVYEGSARIESYPWLGILYYPYMNKRLTTAVVLVTRQIALGAATEIDKLPKVDFRARARVVFGYNCSGPYISIRDYTYHEDYTVQTYSALAMIQLETDLSDLELRPICPPPSHFNNPKFYAMVISNDCKTSKIMIYRMKYVSMGDCQTYYRRNGLDINSMWPSHLACAKSMTGGKCVWRSGAVLTVKIGNKWRLLGFGIYGPGCQAPARFLDYGMYHKWVSQSVSRIGTPSVTTLGENHVVLRRMTSAIQRFGPCDYEETSIELYTDRNTVSSRSGFLTFNVSLYSNMDYSCVIFKAEYDKKAIGKPKLRLRRWCAGPTGVCFGYGFLSIHFYVEIFYAYKIDFEVSAYGKEAQIMDPKSVVRMINKVTDFPNISEYSKVREYIKTKKYSHLLYKPTIKKV